MEAFIIAVVPAIVKFFELLNRKEWGKAGKIILAGLAGAGLGYATGDIAGITNGVISGLAAAGVITVAGKINSK